MGGGTFHREVTHQWGVAYPWGVDFGPNLVDGWQGGWHPGGGSAKPKFSLLAKPLELQYYCAQGMNRHPTETGGRKTTRNAWQHCVAPC